MQKIDTASSGPRPGRASAAVLVGLGVAALAFGGLLLWWRHGDAVFGTYLLGAMAWCF